MSSYRIAYHRGLWESSYKGQVTAHALTVAMCCHEHDCAEEALLCAMDLRLTLPECPPAPRKPLLVIRVDDGNEWDMAPTYSRYQADIEDERHHDEVYA